MKKPIALIVLDGWGYREDVRDNAIAAAKKPNFDEMWAKYPHSLLDASGFSVGLPTGQMGNSEVGHMTIGAGKPIDTDLVRINKAIDSGEFQSNSVFSGLFEYVLQKNSTLHVMGLVSPGGVHSHQDHLFAFLRLAKEKGIKTVAVHVFADGRDTPPQSASEYVSQLESVIAELGSEYFISTISGRYYAMDRDNNWDRLRKTEDAMFDGVGQKCTTNVSDYLKNAYKENKTDEMLEPAVCSSIDAARIKKDDGVFFFNFRADRARMISEKMIAKKTEGIYFASMTEYSDKFDCPVAFPPLKVEETLGKAISDANLRQARITETEKFAHATYFLNCGREKPYDGEKDILLNSRKDVKTHDQAPEMRAKEIADAAIQEIESGIDFMFINFANADMVGHTANVPSIISAIEFLDVQLKRVVDALVQKGGLALITADHGNAEINIDQVTGTKHTAHTTDPVPFILTSNDFKVKDGHLYDLAPTVLHLFGLKIPKSMTGKPLVE